MRGRVAGGVVLGLVGAVAVAGWRMVDAALSEVECGQFANGMEYQRSGTGSRTVLWLIGSPLRAAPPSRLMQVLLNRMHRPLLDAGYTIWMVGRPQHMPAGYTIPKMAADTANLIDEHFSGVVDVVVGESFGGMIGQYLAARRPDSLKRLVLVVSGCEVSEWSRQTDEQLIGALQTGDIADARAIVMQDYAPGGRATSRPLPGADALLWHLLGLEGIPPGDLVIEAKAAGMFDSRPVLPSISTPAVLIAGDQDRYFLPSVVEETAELIPNCKLIWHAGQGHLDVIRDQRTPREILDFVTRTEPAHTHQRTNA